MKRLVLVIVALTVGLAGCGGQKTKQGITLTIWETYNTEERAIFLPLVQQFEQANPGIKLEPVSIPFDGLEPKILTSLATGTAPDIARVDVGFLPKVAIRGALAPLDSYGIGTVTGQLRPVALASCVVGGKTYGLPDQVNGLCLFYNREMFTRAGLDPTKPPETWQAFVEYARKLTDKQTGTFGFGMRNSLWWSLPFIYSFGGDILDANGKCALAGEQAVAGFQFKVDLYAKYGVEGGAWRAGGIRDDLGFQSRKYAMVFNGPWAVKGLQDAGIDFGVALIPSGPAGHATNVGGNDLVVFATSKHPAEAAKFLMFMVSTDVQAKWANSLGQIPVNVAADPLVDQTKHPYLKVFMEQMKYAKPRAQTGSYPDIENAVNPEMQAALDSKKSVEEAMESAAKLVDGILAEEADLKASLK
ncbi:MAG TPA: extracellular solute-binding protein [bacterium]|nr:extracellular solute-binding protein [bacterium]